MSREIDPNVYVSAILCQEVMTDQYGIPSAIRLTNKVLAVPVVASHNLPDGRPNPDQPRVAIFQNRRLAAIITFYTEMRQTVNFRTQAKRPDGTYAESTQEGGKNINLGDGANGQLLNTTISIATESAGVHWLELIVDDRVVTKLPLEISHPPGLDGLQKVSEEEWSAHMNSPLQTEEKAT